MPSTGVAHLDKAVIDEGGREAAAAYEHHGAARRVRHVIDKGLVGFDVVSAEGRAKSCGSAIRPFEDELAGLHARCAAVALVKAVDPAL